MWSADPRLQRQRAGLVRFVQINKSRFDFLPWEPWTVDPRAGPVEIRSSTLLPGSLGVFFADDSAHRAGLLLGNYPGVLMWDELLDDFHQAHHCPTAVGLSVLDYPVSVATAQAMGLRSSNSFDAASKTWTVHMCLVGDPTHVGPIFNSPYKLGVPANCRLQQCRKEIKDSFILRTRSTIPGQRARIRADVITVELVARRLAGDASELLCSYDAPREEGCKEGFWARLDANKTTHCDVCFESKHDDSDVLYLCSAEPCCFGRHKRCFASSDAGYREADWYCSKHRSKRKLGAVSLSIIADVSRSPLARTATVSERPPQLSIPAAARPPVSTPSRAEASSVRTHSDSNESDSDSEEDPGPSSTPRTQSSSSSSSSSGIRLNIPPSLPPAPTQTVDFTAVRKVWTDHARQSGITLKKRRAKWHLTEGDWGSRRERKQVDGLDRALHRLNTCCATRALLKHYEKDCFDSIDKLLAARLAWRASKRFDNDAIEGAIKEQLENRWFDEAAQCHKTSWQGLALCDTCYACAIGKSRSSLYRICSTFEGRQSIPKSGGSNGKVAKKLLGQLLNLSAEQSAHNPTGAQRKDGSTEVVLQLKTKVQVKELLEEQMLQQHGLPFQIAQTSVNRALGTFERFTRLTSP